MLEDDKLKCGCGGCSYFFENPAQEIALWIGNEIIRNNEACKARALELCRAARSSEMVSYKSAGEIAERLGLVPRGFYTSQGRIDVEKQIRNSQLRPTIVQPSRAQNSRTEQSNHGGVRKISLPREEVLQQRILTRADVHREIIEEAMIKTGKLGIDAVVYFDSSRQLFCYSFVSVGRSRAKSENAIELIYAWGFGGGGSQTGEYQYTGKNGLYGQVHHVVRDFRPKVMENSFQNGVKFIPIASLSVDSGCLTPIIPMPTLEVCVDYTKLK